MKLEEHSIVAWVGEDELGSGKIGLKQAFVPAGMIPIVAMDYNAAKIQTPLVKLQLEAQAATYGKKIRLVRFKFDSIVEETECGK